MEEETRDILRSALCEEANPVGMAPKSPISSVGSDLTRDSRTERPHHQAGNLRAVILLDTNVLSALMQRTPSLEIVRWLDRQPQTSIWTTSITIFEIRIGVESMQPGRWQSELASVLDIMLEKVIQQRIASFDARAAGFAASLAAKRKPGGTKRKETR